MSLTGTALGAARTAIRCLAFIAVASLAFSVTTVHAQDSVIVGPPDDPYVVYGSGLPTTYTPTKSANTLSTPPVDDVNITTIDPSRFPSICTAIEVLDSAGNPIGGLDFDSFCVFQDGIPIDSFEVVETPVDSCFTSIALVIDVSGSMDLGDKLDTAKAAAHSFVDNMDIYDRVAIVKFSSCFEVVQDFTGDKALLHTKIDALTAGGWTAAFDGIWKGVDITTTEFGSKAVIALSDGMENRSWECPGGTDGLLDGFTDDSTIIVSLAQAASIPIYTISLGALFDPRYLEALANGSGGFHSHAPTASEIRDIYEVIKFRLCSRYVICYASPDTIPNGDCHTVEICNRDWTGACIVCDTSEYCEPRPPWIQMLVQAECHPANSDLEICARVGDPDTPRDSLDVKLFYRVSDLDPFTSVPMVHTAGDTFCYVIPGDLFPSCLMEDVQFYGTASDGRTTVADPDGAPLDYYTISICKGDPPVCEVPDDITIFQCDPAEVCLPVGCYDVTGNRIADPVLISGPGAIADDTWCYTPTGDETVNVTIQCTDTCGQVCEGTFTVTFDMNDAPVCNATSSTGPPLCVPPVHVVTFETTDADDNLTDCVLYGDGELTDHSWQIVAPQPNQTVSARIVCYDECRDSCWIDINFTFPDPVEPICNIPDNTTFVLCEIEADSLPVSATAGAVCEITDGPGELRNGYWVYEPAGSEEVTVSVECRSDCDTCRGTFTVTYVINTPPVLTCRGSGSAECSDVLTEADIPLPDISDEHPETVVLSTHWDTIPGDCEDSYIIEITWVGTDECGATDTCLDVINVTDTGDPYFVDCPTDTMYRECGTVGTIPPPEALDDCDTDVDVTIIDSYTVAGDCPQAYISVTTWEARDNCGNTATCQHIYKHVDQTPPVIDCPEPVAYDCDNVPPDFPPPPAIDYDPSGTFICDPNPVVTEIGRASSTTEECPQGYHLTIMWEAMDACGNADTCTQVVDVIDTTRPEFVVCPGPDTLDCNVMVQLVPPDATDNCDPAPVVTEIGSSREDDPDCPSAYELTVLWEAMDACGNADTCEQTFVFVDTLPPTIECPPPSSQYCGLSTPPIPDPNVLDNCDLNPSLWLERIDTIEGTCPQNYTAHLIWMAEDNCGNIDSCTQEIEYYDDQPPDCDGHPPLFYSCDAVPAVFPLPVALDECDPDPQVILISRDSTGGACPNSYTLALNYDFIDACGNSSSHTQVVEVDDVTKPHGIEPRWPTYNCDDDIDPLPPPTGLDNCDPNPTVSLISVYSGGVWGLPCPQNDSLWVEWEVEDACGNADTFVQIIAIVDTEAPVMECGGPDTVQCTGGTITSRTPTATDNCDPAPVVDVIDEYEIPDPDCPQAYELVTTFEARDACGNSTTCVLHTFVIDTLPPVITCLPPATLSCERTSVLPPPTYYDECDPSPTLRLNRIDTITGPCAHTYTEHLYWEAEDACGNIDSCRQVIDYVDNEPPTCEGHDPLFYDCDAVPDVFPEPLVQDNCDPDPQLQFMFYDSVEWNCPQSYMLTLHWEATDDCGNSSVHDVMVYVQDTTRPDITCPADTIVSCEEFDGAGIKDAVISIDPFIPYDYRFGEPSATDNCDPNPSYGLRRIEQLNDDRCDTEYRLTFGAFDACGNFDSCFQTVHVVDTTAPVCEVPNDTTFLSCEPGLHLCLPISAVDACGSQVFCRVESGPGSISVENEWCYVASGDETFTVVIACADDCGNECQGEFTVTIEVNDPPGVSFIDPGLIRLCERQTVCIEYTVTDADDNVEAERLIDGPSGSVIDTVANTVCFMPTADSGVYTITVEVEDSCEVRAQASIDVTVVVNRPPVCEAPNDTTVFVCEPGDTVWLPYSASDPDDNLDTCTIADGPGGLTETHYYYVASVEEEFDVTLACYDTCDVFCEGTFHLTIDLNEPPFVEAPDDTTILVCKPGDTICLGPWPQIDLDNNIMTRWVNFGWMDPPNVCFVADTPGVYIIDDCLEDSCGLIDCDTVIVTVIFNSPPVCEVRRDTTIVLCEIAEVCIPIGTSDPDGNLDYCEVSGVRDLDQWCYTPQGDETVTVTVYCVDSCGAECASAFNVIFDLVDPPVCELPADTYILVCEPGEIISLPVSVDDPDEALDSCFITSGPGSLVNGNWEYEATVTEQFCVGIECIGVCGVACADSFCVTIRINEPPFVKGPDDTTLFICKPGDTICLGPWPQIDFDYNIAERFVHFGWMDPPNVCFIADTSGVYTIDDCLTDSCGLTHCDTAYITILVNTPPVCYVPNDTTITMCEAAEVALAYDVFDADDNLVGCSITDGPGTLVNGSWVYTPTGDTTVCVKLECVDECDIKCVDTFCVTFNINDPPVCEVPEDTIIYQCEPTEVKLAVGALDDDDNLIGCELIAGAGKIEDGEWIYTPAGDETVCNTIRCTDECGDTCEADFCVVFEITDPPVCALPNDTTIDLCVVQEVCLPVGLVGDWKNLPGSGGDVRIPSRGKDRGILPSSADRGQLVLKAGTPTVCNLVSGPGYISDGQWCYTPPDHDTTVIVTVECYDTCEARCEGSFTVNFNINEAPECAWIDIMPPGPCPTEGTVIPMFFSSTDPDGDATECTLWVDEGNVTMPDGFVEVEHIPGDTVNFAIICKDPCGDSCMLTMAFRFPEIETVTCPDITEEPRFWCEPRPDSVFVGGHCDTTNNAPGLVRNGWWVYTPSGDETVEVDLMCVGPCNDICYTSFSVTYDINEPPTCWVGLEGDTAHYWFCDPEEICISFGGSDQDENLDRCELVSGPGSVFSGDGQRWCYTPQPATDEIFEVTIRCVDECGAESFCSFFVDIDMNQPPICESPNDTTIFLCGPTQVCLPIGGATDPDDNLEGCYPGGADEKNGVWCYYAQTEETVPVITRCVDVCGAWCEDTLWVTFDFNEAPVCEWISITPPGPCPTEGTILPMCFSSMDPDDDATQCTLYVDEGNVTMVNTCVDVEHIPGDTVDFAIICKDPCGDSCVLTMAFRFPERETVTCPDILPQSWFRCDLAPDSVFVGGHCDTTNNAPGFVRDGYWVYTPTGDESFTVELMCIGLCDTCYTSFLVDIDINEPPVCDARNDTTIFLCAPTEVCLPIAGGTDPDGNLEWCAPVGDDEKVGVWCYSAQTEETVPVITHCEDACGAWCEDTFYVTFDFNEAPVCEISQDTAFFLCGPTEIVLPMTVTDADDNVDHCGFEGPGEMPRTGESTSEWRYFADHDTIFTVLIFCEDVCGARCEQSFEVRIDMNEPPVCAAPNDTAITLCDSAQVCLPISALDADDNLVGCVRTSGPGQIDDGQWCYTPTASGPVTVIVTCSDLCGASCSDTFTVDFEVQGTVPVCNFPNDTSILLCSASEVCLPYSATDPDGGEVTCEKISGPGSLVDGNWCFTPSSDQEAVVTIRCTDPCGNSCEGTFEIVFDINDAPTISLPEEVTKVICGIEQVCIPVTASDANGNLDHLEVVDGPGQIIGSSWCYTPPAYDQTINVRIRAVDACGLSAQRWMRVNIDYNEVPTCELPPSGRIILCEPGELCLTFSEVDPASMGITCTILDGGGEIRGGQWCYDAAAPGIVSVNMRCTSVCGDVCTVSRTYTIEIDAGECDAGPAAVSPGPIVQITGDLDNSGTIDVLDLVLLSRAVYHEARPTATTAAFRVDLRGDVNCDGRVNDADVVYLAGFLFREGPAPCTEAAATAVPPVDESQHPAVKPGDTSGDDDN